MKITMALIAACSVATSVYADLTEFRFSSSSKTDGVTSSDVVNIFLDDDDHFDMLDCLESGRYITLSDYFAFTPIASVNPAVTTVGPNAGKWATAFITDDSSAYVGKYAFAVINTHYGFDVGDTLRISTLGGLINDLRPDGPGGAVTPGQTFDPGALMVVQEIPEPTTISLIGIAGVGVFLARRNIRRNNDDTN